MVLVSPRELMPVVLEQAESSMAPVYSNPVGPAPCHHLQKHHRCEARFGAACDLLGVQSEVDTVAAARCSDDLLRKTGVAERVAERSDVLVCARSLQMADRCSVRLFPDRSC